jgi:hypothetical protein
MNNVIVWIYGASAAGKETFIRKIVSDKSQKIISELGWSNKTIVACEESIEWVAQFEGDPKKGKRKQIPYVVIENIKDKENVITLIKGQDVDLKENLPIKLYDLLPDCSHCMVFLKVDIEQLYIRVQRKIWWKPEDTKEMSEQWLHDQMKLLKNISSKLPITVVDSNNENYHLVELPEKLV